MLKGNNLEKLNKSYDGAILKKFVNKMESDELFRKNSNEKTKALDDCKQYDEDNLEKDDDKEEENKTKEKDLGKNEEDKEEENKPKEKDLEMKLKLILILLL